MTEPVVRLEGLCRYYGSHAALRSLSFEVEAGTVTALVGRNGAGKTTALRLLLGLETPTRGSASVFGRNSRELRPDDRARIGYVAEGHPLPGWMTVTACERFDASFHSGWNARLFAAVLEHFGLRVGQRVSELSRGQRAGLSLALALAPDPELLVLDDPCLGLDPIARHAFLESMVHVVEKGGRTILLSSHLVSDVERLADRLVVIDEGRLRASCPTETLQRRVRRFVLTDEETETVKDEPGFLCLERRDGRSLVSLVVSEGEPGPAGAREGDPLSLEQALQAYLGERGERRSFFDSVGGVG